MAPSARDRLAGSILGTAVGDALGMPFELADVSTLDPGEFRKYHPGGAFNGPNPDLAPGRWTDETATMIIVLETLLNNGPDLNEIRRRLHAWAGGDDLRFPENDLLAAARSQTPVKSESCASAARSLPLGFLLDEDAAVAVGRLTHESKECDRWISFLHEAVGRDADFVRRNYERLRGEWEGGSSAWVRDACMCALRAVAGTESFAGAVSLALSFGGKTDSVGAITGGLAGALYGAAAISEDYILTLEKGGYLGNLADMLYETFSERFTE